MMTVSDLAFAQACHPKHSWVRVMKRMSCLTFKKVTRKGKGGSMWLYPVKDFPEVVWHCTTVPGTVYQNATLLEQARGVLRTYNADPSALESFLKRREATVPATAESQETRTDATPEPQFSFDPDSLCLVITEARIKTVVKMWLVDGHVWFQGKGSALALGYSAPTDSVRQLVPDTYRKPFRELKAEQNDRSRGADWDEIPELVCLHEKGFLRLLYRSNQPRAVAFREWLLDIGLQQIHQAASLTQQSAPSSFPALETIQLDATVFLDESKRHLYVISTDAELAKGNLKIGIAGDVMVRIAQLQTSQNDFLRVLVVFLHAEKLETSVLKRLPLSGTGGAEWRAASIDQVKQVVLEAYEELKTLSNLPAPPSASLKRKREDSFETRQQEMEFQMQLERHQDERKIAMDKHQLEIETAKDKHQFEMEAMKDKHECELDRHKLACERERLELRRMTIEIRKQEIALGM
jgi:prophage antirepressor-like protein